MEAPSADCFSAVRSCGYRGFVLGPRGYNSTNIECGNVACRARFNVSQFSLSRSHRLRAADREAARWRQRLGERTFVTLGDMTVVDPAALPGRLLAALGIIGTEFHPAFDRQPWLREPGYSKQSCLLTSLTVRDFLREIGFADANVRSVAAVMRAEHERPRGAFARHRRARFGQVPGAGRFAGHIVAVVPERAAPDRHDALSGDPAAMARRAHRHDGGALRRAAIRRAHVRACAVCRRNDRRRRGRFAMTIVWLDRRDNKVWRKGGDNEEWRRVAVLAALRERIAAGEDMR